MAINGKNINPERDATLGLIFRLNALWAENDIHAKNGDYDAWNNLLDIIYRNLLYRENMIIEKDDSGNIKKIKLCDDDEKEFNFLSKNISTKKINYLRAKGIINGIPAKKIARVEWYKSLSLKDIWLRKLMQGLGLYIKETVRTPGNAMWG